MTIIFVLNETYLIYVDTPVFPQFILNEYKCLKGSFGK